eukprot:m.23462 g.23462  ORF g.23462 m.23462 type:complete len:543 (+) comp5545_c1_seq1:34-1662(+)
MEDQDAVKPVFHVFVFPLKRTIYPITTLVAEREIKLTGDKEQFLSNPFEGESKHLISICSQVEGGSLQHVCDPAKQLLRKRTEKDSERESRIFHVFHTLHANHPSLACCPVCFQHVLCTHANSTSLHSVQSYLSPSCFGQVYVELLKLITHIGTSTDTSCLQSILVQGNGGNFDLELTLHACEQSGMGIINIHEFDGISSANMAHIQRLALQMNEKVILFIENIDLLFPDMHDVEDEVMCDLYFMRSFLSMPSNIICVATTQNSLSDIHATIRNDFAYLVSVDTPSRDQHLAFIEKSDVVSSILSENLKEVLLLALRYESLSTTASLVHQLGEEWISNNSCVDEKEVLGNVVKSLGYGKIANNIIAPTSWGKGVFDNSFKREIIQDLSCFLPNIVGIPPPRCVVVAGPSGCGKTNSVNSLATVLGINMLCPKLADLVKGEVGESERHVHELFEKAKKLSPCLIIFDEMTSIFGATDTSSSTSVMVQTIQELDMLQMKNESQVFLGKESIFVLAVFVTLKVEDLDETVTSPSRCFKVYEMKKG